MTLGYIRVQGTHHTGEPVTTETENTRVEGVINEQTSTFNVVISLEDDYEFALDVLTAVIQNNSEAVAAEVLPNDVTQHIDFETDEVNVEAGIEDTSLAYGLASRVAGQNRPDADMLGQTATHVEGILLDFAMERRGADVNGLHSAARTALIEHAFDDMTAGNAEYGAEEREAVLTDIDD